MIVIERGHVRSNGMNNESALWEELYGDTPRVRLVDVVFGPGAYVALQFLGCAEGYYGATTNLCCRIMRKSIGLVGEGRLDQARNDFMLLEKAANHMECGTYLEIRNAYKNRRMELWDAYIHDATTPRDCMLNAIGRSFTPDIVEVARLVIKANKHDANIHDYIRTELTIVARCSNPDEAPHD